MFVAAVFCVTAADERLNLIKRTHFDNLPALHCMQSAHGVNHREESRAECILRGKRTCAQRQNRGWTWENKLSSSNFIVPAAFSDCFVTHSRNFELQTKVNHALSPICRRCWSSIKKERDALSNYGFIAARCASEADLLFFSLVYDPPQMPPFK